MFKVCGWKKETPGDTGIEDDRIGVEPPERFSVSVMGRKAGLDRPQTLSSRRAVRMA